MKHFLMNKLLRDKVPETMKEQGKLFESRILNDEEFVEQLKIKLKEEITEFDEVDVQNTEELKNELADVEEIVEYLLKAVGLSKTELDEIRKKKVEKAGGFEKRIYVGKVSLQDDDSWVDYYRKKGFEEIED